MAGASDDSPMTADRDGAAVMAGADDDPPSAPVSPSDPPSPQPGADDGQGSVGPAMDPTEPEPAETEVDMAAPASTDPAAECLFPLPCPDAPPAPGSLFEHFTPLPENPAECPIAAPENPWGPCAGYPVYIGCGYTNGTQVYNCICDWVHWICI